jgi:hypothetical protein
MNRPLAVVSLVSTFLIAGCRTWPGDYQIGAGDHVLASRQLGGGSVESYRLDHSGAGTLRVVREFDRDHAVLGFEAAELDKPGAERRGVKPYSGLLVEGVVAKSSADQGGVLAGDVLLSLDDKETVYLPQLAAIEATLRDGQTVHAKLLRGQQHVELSLSAKWQKQRVTEEQSVPLEVPAVVQRPVAGVTLRGIPAAWCEKIFGAPREAVVVTHVEVGSPAWVAGIRAGDVIDTLDGAPVPNVREVMRMVAARGANEQPMAFGVRRGNGPGFEGNVELHDYSGQSGVWLPLVFHLRNGTYEDRWSVGPFGLLLSNRNQYIADNTTRLVKTRNVFSAVLGLFRVETTPEETEVRLLWIIRFDT